MAAGFDLPPIFLLPTHIDDGKLAQLQSQIPTLTFDIGKACIILGNIFKKERAIFELRRRNVNTTEIHLNTNTDFHPPFKQRKLSTTRFEAECDVSNIAAGEDENPTSKGQVGRHKMDSNRSYTELHPPDVIKVIQLDWFTKSVAKGQVLPTHDYLIYQGHKELQISQTQIEQQLNPADILRRARAEGENVPIPQTFAHGSTNVFKTQTSPRRSAGSSQHPRTSIPSKRPPLLLETTTEHDIDEDLPPIPEFLHTTYSCERPTPFSPPNDTFIDELKRIRTTRLLTGDKVGVRAYSSCIASLAAYPYALKSQQEVARLPSCGPKIARLFHEWKETGQIEENENAAKDPELIILGLFYEIWGVGETTAREFYNKGWRELDDVVEFGWDSLSRVQQIGVKYYDEFLLGIPRQEVETIGERIVTRANSRYKGFQMVIVGGYRRGKERSGDVDVVLSHPDQNVTHNFVEELVLSLEKDKIITHTLILSTRNSERGQTPVAWKGEDRKSGSGFDTLDKALVVWQDPEWDKTKFTKNPNPHRRVDIIISPWKTAGCAVIGWSGGTTFQRDLRRYCKAVKSLKFDSSGIRSRTDGQWVDLESIDGQPAPDLLTAEKRVFQGLGLEWRLPNQRCTG